MDFLSIRKKARERAEAREAGAGSPAAGAPAGAAPPPAAVEPQAPPPSAPASPAPAGAPTAREPPPTQGSFERKRRGTDTVVTEEELREGVLQERYAGLAPTTDGRFATWRPGSGPPPMEPDDRGYERPASPEAAGPEAFPEPELEPLPDDAPRGREPPPPRARSATAASADPLDVFFYRPDEESGFVPAIGGGPEEPAPRAPETLDEFLTFKLGEEEYAVAIDHVREVMRAPAITEVPRAPAHVLGVVTVRGEVVAVVDTRSRLGLAGGPSAAARIVIVDTGDGPLGLLVDGVTSVVRLPHGAIEPCPQGISTGAADCVTGIGRQRDRLFMVVDAAAILPVAHPAEH